MVVSSVVDAEHFTTYVSRTYKVYLRGYVRFVVYLILFQVADGKSRLLREVQTSTACSPEALRGEASEG